MTAETFKAAAMKYPHRVTPPFDLLMSRIGYESLCAISEEFGGQQIYIPTVKNLFRKCIAEEVLREFDGGNHLALARKYGYTVKGIRDIVQTK